MAIVKLTKNNIEYSGIQLHPSIYYSSSSIEGEGVTGSMYVSPFRSKTLIKKNNDNIIKLFFSGQNSEEFFEGLSDYRVSQHLNNLLATSLGSIGKVEIDKNSKKIDIKRIVQPNILTTGSIIKNYIRKSLMPNRQQRFQGSHFTYSNYNTINFFKRPDIVGNFDPNPLLYYNKDNAYELDREEFSVNFWINPRYTSTGDIDAGTILHMSSSIAISLVTGSHRNEKDEIDEFKILLQLSHSADALPSSINLDQPSTAYPNDLIFTSSNVIKKDHWHHVCVQWGPNFNNQTGSIFIDNNETSIYVPSSSITSSLDMHGLTIGNYCNLGKDDFLRLFNTNNSESQGYTNSGISGVDPSLIGKLPHQLEAEIHELKIFNHVLSEDKSSTSKGKSEREIVKDEGISRPSIGNRRCLFYLGPYFYPESTERKVLYSPHLQTGGEIRTSDPFNVEFSHRVSGKIINIENFTVDLANEIFPRHINMFPAIASTSTILTAQEYIESDENIEKRNLFILPCDNGLFKPNYDYYNFLNYSDDYDMFKIFNYPKTQYNTLNANKPENDYSIISLTEQADTNIVTNNNVITTLDVYDTQSFDNAISNNLLGPNPVNTYIPGANPSRTQLWSNAQHTRDTTSREVTIFDISNLYYGNRIYPGSFEIIDNNLTGSSGQIKMKLKDNGLGSLYRADAKTKLATWNNVGNVFYEEGLVIIKSPHITPFGSEKFEINMQGEQNIHSMILNVPAYKRLFNSSSNPTFTKITPSDNANDEDLDSIYVTTVNIHDKNFNIVMKANFSQPVVKTRDDEFVVRLKEDF